jgi:hypothetical protein
MELNEVNEIKHRSVSLLAISQAIFNDSDARVISPD